MSWDVVALGEICDVRDGTHDSPKYHNTGVPLVTSKNLCKGRIDFTNTSYISEQDHLNISKRSKVDNGDILYAMIGTLGNPVIVSSDTEFSIKNVGLIKFNADTTIYNRYLIHALNSDFVEQQIAQSTRGGTQKFISLKVLRSLRIPLPPLPIQKQIAAILEKADTLRQQCQQMEAELNRLAQSVFLDMFGDPVSNPKSWKFKTISQIIVRPLQNGAYYEKDKYIEDGVEMAHMGDTFNGIVERGKIKRVDAATSDIEKYALTANDILVSRRSLVYEGAAKPCLIPSSTEPLIYESSMIRVSPKHEEILPEYLYHYLNNQRVREAYLFKYVTKSTISGINQTNLAKVEIMVPPIELQKQFRNILNAKELLFEKLKGAKYERGILFNALMQRAFKGELNLKTPA